MMDRTQKLVIEIDPLRATMVLKQEILGVISRKEICPEDLFQAIIHATDRKTFVSSGLLPKGCFSVEICGSGAKRYCLLCQQRYADITYHNIWSWLQRATCTSCPCSPAPQTHRAGNRMRWSSAMRRIRRCCRF